MSLNDLDSKLFDAALEGDLAKCRALIKRGANIHTTDSHQDTPLICAASNGHVEVCRFLIDSGAEINAPNKYNGTAMHAAAGAGSLPVFELLIKHGGDPKLISDDHYSSLHMAAYYCNKSIAHYLFEEHGEDPNQVTQDGKTLDQIAQSAHEAIVGKEAKAAMLDFFAVYRSSLLTQQAITDALPDAVEPQPPRSRSFSPL